MKKSTKKLVSVLLASAMAAGMLAGCGSGNGKGSTGDSKSSSAVSGTSGDNLNADTSEHVDLTMYLIGDRTPDSGREAELLSQRRIPFLGRA